MALTICEINAENLFISMEFYKGQDLKQMDELDWKHIAMAQLQWKQKPLKKVWGLAHALLDINADIIMMVEVGGRESLDFFNTYFLNASYEAHFVESNSSRVIDLAFLVKKNLPYVARTASHREKPIVVKAYQGEFEAKFSRDVAELGLYKSDQLELILLLTHLKSKISTSRDFQGTDMRRAEAEALALIYENVKSQHPSTPIVVGGDFNSDLSSPELERLAKTDLADFHDLVGTEKEQRISLVHFNFKGLPIPQILDYLMISPHLKNKVIKEKSYTYRYKGFYDIPHPLPSTLKERQELPSDHYPLVLTLEL